MNSEPLVKPERINGEINSEKRRKNIVQVVLNFMAVFIIGFNASSMTKKMVYSLHTRSVQLWADIHMSN